jgi:hypothetical protein
VQGPGDPNDVEYTEVSLAALDPSEVSAMQASSVCQFFL